jgi:hypothetical protein
VPGAPHKLARDLEPGDRVMVNVNKYLPVSGEVIAVERLERIIKRRMVRVTIRTKEGQEVHRQYGEQATIPLAPPRP